MCHVIDSITNPIGPHERLLLPLRKGSNFESTHWVVNGNWTLGENRWARFAIPRVKVQSWNIKNVDVELTLFIFWWNSFNDQFSIQWLYCNMNKFNIKSIKVKGKVSFQFQCSIRKREQFIRNYMELKKW